MGVNLGLSHSGRNTQTVLKKRALRKIFGPKMAVEVTEG
jgi:hypothetical protein